MMSSWAAREAIDLIAELRHQQKLTPEQAAELHTLIQKGHVDIVLDILTATM